MMASLSAMSPRTYDKKPQCHTRDPMLLDEGLGMDSAFLQQLYPQPTSPFFTHPDINFFTCLLSHDTINSELHLIRSHFY